MKSNKVVVFFGIKKKKKQTINNKNKLVKHTWEIISDVVLR